MTDRLKAPSTAEFVDGDVTSTGDIFTVDGAVDSQNSFGAMIRTSYVCTVQLNPSGTRWSLVSLDTDP